MQQIERLCKQQSENKRLEQTMNATEENLAAERSRVHMLEAQVEIYRYIYIYTQRERALVYMLGAQVQIILLSCVCVCVRA